jgi:dolichol-phosphate mannosyltransferase
MTDLPLRRESLVIVPTYNEAENLKPLVRQILQQGPFDVLVIDDHSPDGTGQLADELAAGHPGRVAVQHRIRKLGLGSAYVQGFRYALAMGYDRVFQMDADFSHHPVYLPVLREALDAADVALGSRYAPGGGTRDRSPSREAMSCLGSFYAALLLGLPFHDLTGGFKGFRRRALQAVDLGELRSTGFAFQIEVTYRCFQRGLNIVEVPILFKDRERGRSKLSWSIVAEAFLQVWRLRFGFPDHGRAERDDLVYVDPPAPLPNGQVGRFVTGPDGAGRKPGDEPT